MLTGPALTVSVLGALEVRRNDEPLAVPGGKSAEVLVRLALEPGTPVRTDSLLADLWVEPTARNTLQSKVSQLRRALGVDAVVAAGDGYRLAVAADAVDAVRVVELARRSAAARAAGDLGGALAWAQEGLELFRGEALLPDAGDWAEPHRTRLDAVRLDLQEIVVAARLELGWAGDLVPELEELTRAHPWHEGFWAALITALYRAGRQTDALAAHHRVRDLLRDELGIEPGPALMSLEERVLRQSPDLLTRSEQPRLAAGNVPPLTGETIGRDAAVEDVVAALSRSRLATILGPGGVGKTRLALEAGHRLRPAGGVWLVRLDAVGPRAELPEVLATTMHLPGGSAALRERLAGIETVLLLDNCEHLIGPVAALVEGLLAEVPRLRVLATSQARLGVEDEVQLPLAPLAEEDSMRLFALRAAETRPRFALDPGAADLVAEVCRSLDGLPLAIELAAARVRSLSLREIARRLDDRFALLSDPSSRRPARRRALRAAVAWSYDLLFPDEQRGLWALCWFAGGATLAAVEQVLPALGVPATAALDTVSRLVDRSLVKVIEVDGGELRYDLLDSIRAFAVEQLEAAGETERVRAAHAGWLAAVAARCDAEVRTSRQADCLAVARAERANVDLALSWCAEHDADLGARIAIGFGWTWVVLGDATAGAARVRRALAETAPESDRVAGWLLSGWLEASAGDLVRAQADLDAARRLARLLDDDLLLADVDRHRAFLEIQWGRPDETRAAAAAALGTYRRHGRLWATAAALLLGAYGALMLGDTSTAGRDASEAVRILTPIGDSWGLVHGEAMLGAVAQAEGRFGDAAAALRRAADTSADSGFVGQASLHRATLGRVLQRAGDPAAEATYRRAIVEATVGGDGRLAASARVQLARWCLVRRRPAEALGLLTECERWYAAAGGGDGALLARCLLAAVRDDSDELQTVLAEAEAAGAVEARVHALDALARLAQDTGDGRLAHSLLSQADELAIQVSHLIDDGDRFDSRAARRPG